MRPRARVCCCGKQSLLHICLRKCSRARVSESMLMRPFFRPCARVRGCGWVHERGCVLSNQSGISFVTKKIPYNLVYVRALYSHNTENYVVHLGWGY